MAEQLTIEIEADASKAEKALDSLSEKLKNLDKTLSGVGSGNNGIKSLSSQASTISKEYSGIADSVGNSMKKSTATTTKEVSNMESRLAELTERYKNLGKGFKFSGSLEGLNREIQRCENSLQTALIKKQSFEADNDVDNKMYEHAIKDVAIYSNKIEALKKQQSEMTTMSTGNEDILPPSENQEVNELEAKLTGIKDLVNRIDEVFENMSLANDLVMPIADIEYGLRDAKALAEEFKNTDMSDGLKQAQEAVIDLEAQLEYANEMYDKLPHAKSITATEAQTGLTPEEWIDNYTKEHYGNDNSGGKTYNLTPLKTTADFSNAYELQKYLDSISAKADSVSMKLAKLDSLGANPNTQRYQGYIYDLQQIQATVEVLQPELQRLASEGQLNVDIPNLDTTQAKVSKLNTALANMKVVVKTDALKQTEKELQKVQNRYEQIRKSIQLNMQANQNYGASGTYKKQQVELEALRKEYQDLILKQEELSRVGGGGYKFDFDNLKKSAHSFGETLKGLDIKKSLSTNLNKVKTLLNKITPSAASVAKGFKKMTNSGNVLLKGLTKITKMLKLMIVRMALRSVISGAQEGFQNLAQYCDETNYSISLLMNSLNQLKNAFAAMTSPLLNAFAPALNTVIQVCIKAVNWINQLFSALTGKSTWIKATDLNEDYASSLSDTASAAGSAKDALEDMLGLQGFDELNNLTTSDDSSSSGSGGSGTGTSTADMFTTEDISGQILDLADMIKDAWESGDWTAIGEMVSKKIRKVLKKIDWDKVYKVARKFGSGLATFLNGLINPETFEVIGTTIGNCLNTVLEFLDEFGTLFNFENFGESLSTGIVAALNAINWKTALHAAQKWGEGIGKALNSFLTEDLFDAVGSTLSSLFMTAVELALCIGDEIDFEEITKNLVSGIKTFLNGFDWNKIQQAVTTWGEGFGDIIEGILGDAELFEDLGEWIAEAINTVVKGIRSLDIDWKKIGEALGRGLKKFFKTLDTTEIAEGINDFVDGIKDLIGGFLSEISLTDIAKEFMDLVLNLDADTIGITVGITAAWIGTKIVTKIGKTIALKGLELAVEKAFSSITGASTVGEIVATEVAKETATALGKKTVTSTLKSGLSTALTTAGVATAAVGAVAISGALYTGLVKGIVAIDDAINEATGFNDLVEQEEKYNISWDTSPQEAYNQLYEASQNGDTQATSMLETNKDYFESEGVTGYTGNIGYLEKATTNYTALTEAQKAGKNAIKNYTAETEKAKTATNKATKSVTNYTAETEKQKSAQNKTTKSTTNYIAETEKQKSTTSSTTKTTENYTAETEKAKSTTSSTAKTVTNYTAETEKLKAQIKNSSSATSTASDYTSTYTSKLTEVKSATEEATTATQAWGAETEVEKSLNATTYLNGTDIGTSGDYGKAVATYSTQAANNWTDATTSLTSETYLNGTVKSTASAYGSAVNAMSKEAKKNWLGATSTLSTTTNLTLGGNASIKEWANRTIIRPINETLSTSPLAPSWSVASNLTIPELATGGSVDKGQLFIANEAGAEMVGEMNNRTTVANNTQITEGITAAVTNANTEGNTLLRQEISLLQTQNSLLTELLEKDTSISSTDIFNSVRNSANGYYKRTGKAAFSS